MKSLGGKFLIEKTIFFFDLLVFKVFEVFLDLVVSPNRKYYEKEARDNSNHGAKNVVGSLEEPGEAFPSACFVKSYQIENGTDANVEITFHEQSE